jgi:hypothetical protein
MDYKNLATKALWAAIYGAIAEFAAFQKLDKSTIYVALISALARGVIIFATTFKDAVPTNARNKVIKTWKDNL